VSLGADLAHFLRSVVSVRTDGRRTARLTGPQGSGVLTSVARADALVVVPRGRRDVAAGESVQAIPLGPEGEFTGAFAL
jgi:molybdopterin molybdotransferase